MPGASHRRLARPACLAPFGAGVMSTVGFLVAPIAFDFVRSWRTPLAALDWPRANQLLAAMQDEGRALLMASGVPNNLITHRRAVDMRYVGQGHEIRVPLPVGVLDAAHDLHSPPSFNAYIANSTSASAHPSPSRS